MKCRWRNPIKHPCWNAFLCDWWHRIWCAECRAVERLLMKGVQQLRTEPVPTDGLTRTLAVLELPMKHPTYHKPPLVTTRRMMLATGVLVIGLLLLLPFMPIGRKQSVDTLLAQAIAKSREIKTLRVTGLMRAYKPDARGRWIIPDALKPVVFWFKAPNKWRREGPGRDPLNPPISIRDGDNLWFLCEFRGRWEWEHVLISRYLTRADPKVKADWGLHWTSPTAYLERLQGHLEAIRAKARMREQARRWSNGQKVRVMTIHWDTPRGTYKSAIYIDARTHRLIRIEEYEAFEGKPYLHLVLKRFEYDLPLPDHLFEPPPCPPNCWACERQRESPLLRSLRRIYRSILLGVPPEP